MDEKRGLSKKLSLYGKLLENSGTNFQQIRKGVLVEHPLRFSTFSEYGGEPHIGSYRIFSHSMNNASVRSPLCPHRLPFLTILYRYSPSYCLPFPRFLLSLACIILWPVAFRNLFVIKAAIYFTLIEQIGWLPFAATIYHALTPILHLLHRLLCTWSHREKIIRSKRYSRTRVIARFPFDEMHEFIFHLAVNSFCFLPFFFYLLEYTLDCNLISPLSSDTSLCPVR